MRNLLELSRLEKIEEEVKLKKEDFMKRLMLLFFIGFLALSPVVASGAEVTGEITEVDEVELPEEGYSVIRIRIKNREREIVRAHLGPQWYMSIDVEPGERVTLEGQFRNNEIFMVRTMTQNQNEYRLRNDNMEPEWVRERLRERECIYNPQTEKRIEGKIQNIYMNKNSLTLEARVKLKNKDEIVQVRLGPEWYLRERIRVGDEIELRGSEVGMNNQAMILAREMNNNRLKEEIKLRNREGFPEWSQAREAKKLQKAGEKARRGKENPGNKPDNPGKGEMPGPEGK